MLTALNIETTPPRKYLLSLPSKVIWSPIKLPAVVLITVLELPVAKLALVLYCEIARAPLIHALGAVRT
jgi:hypothetical protein